MEDSLILEAGLEKSVAAVSAMPTAGAYAKSAYILDASILTGTNVVAAGNAGQEVTFIASAGVITIDPSNIAGVTAVSIADNGTLTLRFYGALWYIISYFNSTIV
jgi:hypothetical protein